MNKESTKKIAVGFISLGCAKNLVDSQIMAGNLISENMALAPVPEDADVILVNTCSFIHDAREESFAGIRDACGLKKNGRCRGVIVTGCLPQRYGEKLLKDFPEADAFIGLDEINEIAEVIRRVYAGESGIIKTTPDPKKLFEPKIPGLAFSAGRYAYLKIAEGCNHRCSFCAIPGIRGAHRSRLPEDIIREAEKLLKNGFKELDLISQDTTSYGVDLGKDIDLPYLLRELDKLDGNFRIRMLYGYPTLVTDKLLRTMAELKHVCKYLDIPVQHSHPDILKAMQRSSTIDGVNQFVKKARAIMPDVVLRTTCIAGFPGETEEHFDHLVNYIEKMRFDHLGVFTYSPEEGTSAMGMAGKLPAGLAEDRRNQLMAVQSGIVERKLGELIGQQAEVLLEKQVDETGLCWMGRTERQAPEVDGITAVDLKRKRMKPGEFVRVVYTDFEDYDLEAEELG